MSIKLKKFVDLPRNASPGADDLVLTWDFAANRAKVVPFSELGEGGDYVTVDDLQNILQGYLRQPDLDDYLTEAEIQALLTFATKEEAEAGILEDVFMSPARVKDAIEALAGADLDFATKQEAEEGTKEDVVMSPARTKDAIDYRAVQNGHSAIGFPEALNIVGSTPDGAMMVASATEVGPQGNPEEGTTFLVKSEPEYSLISLTGESEVTARTQATMFFEEDGVNFSIQSGDVPVPWDYDIYLAGLDIPDLDDPAKEDIIGMTPKLTKHLVDQAEPTYATKQEAEEGTKEDVVMSPARTKDAIEHRAVGNLYQNPIFDQFQLPSSTTIAGQFGDGLFVGTYDQITQSGEPYNGTYFNLGADRDEAFMSSTGFVQGEEAVELELIGEERGIFLSADYFGSAQPWSHYVHLAGLTTPDLDDPLKEDIVGMTPKLTKHLIDAAATPEQVTYTDSFTLDASHHGKLIVLGYGDSPGRVVSKGTNLPAGFRCEVVGFEPNYGWEIETDANDGTTKHIGNTGNVVLFTLDDGSLMIRGNYYTEGGGT